MQYNEYRYIYPPRPENKIKPADLHNYEAREFVAMPKYNGDCTVHFTWNQNYVLCNRHNEEKNKVHKSIEFGSLSSICKEKYLVLCGEMLDKAKKDEYGFVLKGFVVWDILVYDSNYLVGSTLRERLDLLDSILPASRMRIGAAGIEQYEHLMFTEHAGIFRSPVYDRHFTLLYHDLIKTDLYEGVVLKKINAKLEVGFNEVNNHQWQVKCRKKTRNYQH